MIQFCNYVALVNGNLSDETPSNHVVGVNKVRSMYQLGLQKSKVSCSLSSALYGT